MLVYQRVADDLQTWFVKTTSVWAASLTARLLRQGHGVMALHLASAQDQGSQVVTRGEPPTGKTKKKREGKWLVFHGNFENKLTNTWAMDFEVCDNRSFHFVVCHQETCAFIWNSHRLGVGFKDFLRIFVAPNASGDVLRSNLRRTGHQLVSYTLRTQT